MSSAADPQRDRWDRLTQPAQNAWRWAWAAAIARTGATGPSEVLVDTVDLLAGLALAQLPDNPVSQLLAHFDLPPGALLGDGGTRRYRAEALLAAYRRVPDAALPPVNEQAEQVLEQAERVLEQALSAMPPSSDGLVTLPMLFGALLETPNIASMALRTELESRGVDAEPVLRSCREHLGARTTYPDHLRDKHPYQPPEVALPSLTRDEPLTRRPPDQPDAEPRDLVGIGAEVDAFASLIASRTLTPPLAVGLFGDWGAGKSYFLRSVQRRIDELVSSEMSTEKGGTEAGSGKAGKSPFYRDIAQVEFNAWQYVEGNLWASLLEHLFRNLRRAGEQEGAPDADDLLATRRNEYLTKITECTAEHREATRELAERTAQKQRADELVQRRRAEREQRLTSLEQARRRNPLRGWRASAALSETLTEVGQRTGIDELGALPAQAEELRQILADTGAAVRRAGPVLGPLRTGGWRYAVALLVVLVVLGLGPLASLALSWVGVPAVSNTITSGAVFLAGLTAYAACGSRMLTRTLSMIAKAQAQLTADIEARREQLDEQVRTAKAALTDSEQQLRSAIAEKDRFAAAVADLEAELARITPSRVLADFVGNRFTSDDYRRHLGVPALVRQDLERLSRLIQQHHDRDADPADRPEIEDRHAIDRVVLYIDDLDRCPTDVVIKVLEAVHLLLAFPLFVVVVAVDARWLESSLREHYTQLGEQPDAADSAVPADYLEKIFQVPFWVRPLGVDTRRQMVRGLLTPNLVDNLAGNPTGSLAGNPAGNPASGTGPIPATAAGGGPVPGVDVSGSEMSGSEMSGVGVPGGNMSDADQAEFARLVESFGVTDPAQRSWQQAATLTVTGPELSLIEALAPLIGATPRAVKRFINIYLLLKSMGRGRNWPMPEQGQVAVLLAISTGLPELARDLLPKLAARSVNLSPANHSPAEQPAEPAEARTLRTILPATADGAAGAQLARLRSWLTDHPGCHDASLSGVDRWVELILRFRFDRASDTAVG